VAHPDAIAACNAVGLDPALLGKTDANGDLTSDAVIFTRGRFATHPNIEVDFLSQGETLWPIRTRNLQTGVRRSKATIPGWTADDGSVDTDFTDIMFLPSNKTKVLLALQERFPGADFSNVQFTRSGNTITVDLSAFTLAQQIAAKTKLLATNFADKLTLIP
jgi:hypothetical protein